jgi:hypothetical protein
MDGAEADGGGQIERLQRGPAVVTDGQHKGGDIAAGRKECLSDEIGQILQNWRLPFSPVFLPEHRQRLRVLLQTSHRAKYDVVGSRLLPSGYRTQLR